MEKIANQVIDFYDDTKGEVLKKRYPSAEGLPAFIKEGNFMTPEERGNIRDSLYALVLDNGEEHMRKFACTDACNTAVSVIYLLDHAKDILPEPAVKTAAQNLLLACRTYDIQAPAQLEKMAGLIPPAPDPYIDITYLDGPKTEQPVDKYCLTKEAKYPIQNYDQILKAIDFFEKNAAKFHPTQRREYSINLANRAEEVGVPITSSIRKYASNEYASKMEIRSELALRMGKTGSDEGKKIYTALFEKTASVSPGVFANMLSQVDEDLGLSPYWDGSLKDPFSAVLVEKTASFSYSTSQGYIDEEDLRRLSEYREALAHAFGEDFADAFKKSPVTQFEALPEPDKNTVIKLVRAAKKW
jgi:hypothetical protein